MVKLPGDEALIDFYLVLRLRMHVAVPSLSYTPLWLLRGQLYIIVPYNVCLAVTDEKFILFYAIFSALHFVQCWSSGKNIDRDDRDTAGL